MQKNREMCLKYFTATRAIPDKTYTGERTGHHVWLVLALVPLTNHGSNSSADAAEATIQRTRHRAVRPVQPDRIRQHLEWKTECKEF